MIRSGYTARFKTAWGSRVRRPVTAEPSRHKLFVSARPGQLNEEAAALLAKIEQAGVVLVWSPIGRLARDESEALILDCDGLLATEGHIWASTYGSAEVSFALGDVAFTGGSRPLMEAPLPVLAYDDAPRRPRKSWMWQAEGIVELPYDPDAALSVVLDVLGSWEITRVCGSAPLNVLARFVDGATPMLAERGFTFEKAWQPGRGWVHWTSGEDHRAPGWGHIRAWVVEGASTAQIRVVARGCVSRRLERALLDVARNSGSTPEVPLETPALQQLLRDYADLLWRGWVNSEDLARGAESEMQLETWVDRLLVRARTDGLSMSSSIGFDRSVDGLCGASVRLNWPTGEPSSAHNSGGLPARLEREWGATLVHARARLEADAGERLVSCPNCKGSGFSHIGDWDDSGRDELFHDRSCERCRGRGRIFEADRTS